MRTPRTLKPGQAGSKAPLIRCGPEPRVPHRHEEATREGPETVERVVRNAVAASRPPRPCPAEPLTESAGWRLQSAGESRPQAAGIR